MAAQTQGIQHLLAAEKKAASVVSEARNRKAKRLKQAKLEAHEEIEKFRSEREQQFREYEHKHLGSRDDIEAKIDEETRKKIAEMHTAVSTHQEDVIGNLLELLYDIESQIHKNCR